MTRHWESEEKLIKAQLESAEYHLERVANQLQKREQLEEQLLAERVILQERMSEARVRMDLIEMADRHYELSSNEMDFHNISEHVLTTTLHTLKARIAKLKYALIYKRGWVLKEERDNSRRWEDPRGAYQNPEQPYVAPEYRPRTRYYE